MERPSDVCSSQDLRLRALGLFESGQATIAQAAELADLPIETFIELLGQTGVPAVSYSANELAGELDLAR